MLHRELFRLLKNAKQVEHHFFLIRVKCTTYDNE